MAIYGVHIKKSHQGLLHKNLGVAKGSKIPVAKLEKAKQASDPAERKRATFALNARKWNKGGTKKSASDTLYGKKD